MTVSDKQISITIIITVFSLILGYFLFWFGYVEIFINHSEVETFQVKSREKIYQCDTNPCRIKIRANKKFLAKIENPLVEKNQTISISGVSVLKTKKIIIQPKKEFPEAIIEEIPVDKFLNTKKSLEKIFKNSISNNFGPILVNPKGTFAVFSRKFAGKLRVFIRNNNSEQLLTIIEDDFPLISLEKNFSLTDNGIIIPAKNRIYYFDFSTQQKQVLIEINSLRTANVSVNRLSNQVIFYNIKEKNWQNFFRNSKEFKKYSNDTIFAGFSEEKEIFIKNNFLYLNGKKSQKIPLEIKKNNQFFLQKDDLIIHQDFSVKKLFFEKL